MPTDEEVRVRVAVRVRPLLPREVLRNHRVCVRPVPDACAVVVGADRTFPFDRVFGGDCGHDELYAACVRPLVEALLRGHNATVFAYGQTGSGKTYTLGGGLVDEDWGIIGRLAQDLFQLLGGAGGGGDGGDVRVEHTVRVSYMELYREELRDLLELHTHHKELHIREDERGNTGGGWGLGGQGLRVQGSGLKVVMGAREAVVSSAGELLSILEAGQRPAPHGDHGHERPLQPLARHPHPAAHPALPWSRRPPGPSTAATRYSKLHLVDLAGSERVGRTGNTGERLKESAYINTGLLALGNVIRALSDPGRSRRGNSVHTTTTTNNHHHHHHNHTHVPYRDAKITRLLRDSLGGTAHTLMVACVSPSHHSMAETLSVLQFAHRARHIRNRPGGGSTGTSRTDSKSGPAPPPWDPGEARLGELAHEVETLREMLRERERELEYERGKAGKAAGMAEEEEVEEEEEEEEEEERRSGRHGDHGDHERTANQGEASLQYLLLVRQAAGLLEDLSTPTQSVALRQREALARDEQELEQSAEALRRARRETQETEQLVEQEILITRLRCDLMTSRLGTSGSSGGTETTPVQHSARRPYSAPLVGHSRHRQPARKIHTSPPTYSLERVMAAFRMRGRLLLAEIEEKEEVFCPFAEPRERRSDIFRCLVSTEIHGKPADLKKAGLRSSTIQRRIHDLSINMRMKEQLMKELDKTGRDAQALERHNEDGGGEGEGEGRGAAAAAC
ncbi:hypothetical protein CRUP_019957 [Coryphaenoides rupestris]|nr:hypothetical protein CRUP_019957 [Coryphaenoides rupestris]